jgi:hypothetical protein
MNKLSFTIIFSLVAIIYSYIYIYIGADAGFYLPISRDISQGLVVYKDIYSGYTPLMMYLNAIIYYFIPDANFYISNLFHYFIILLNGLFFYFYLKKRKFTTNYALQLALLLVIAIITSEGRFINLEIYVTLFVFLAFYFFELKKYFLVGICISLGVLSKQYGVLNYLPMMLLIYFSTHQSFKPLLKFCIASFIVAILFISYFVFIEGIRFNDFLFQLIGVGTNYAKTDRVGFFVELISYIKSGKIVWLLLIPVLINYYETFKKKFIQISYYYKILMLGLLLNLLPTLVTHWAHYFILIFPYLFIIIAYLANSYKKEVHFSLFGLLLILNFYLIIRTYIDIPIKNEQTKIAKETVAIYPKKTKIFLRGKARFMYITNTYENPVRKTIGYDFLYIPNQTFKNKYIVIE